MNYVFGNIQNKFERKAFAKSHITDRKSLTSWELPTSANHSYTIYLQRIKKAKRSAYEKERRPGRSFNRKWKDKQM